MFCSIPVRLPGMVGKRGGLSLPSDPVRLCVFQDVERDIQLSRDEIAGAQLATQSALHELVHALLARQSALDPLRLADLAARHAIRVEIGQATM